MVSHWKKTHTVHCAQYTPSTFTYTSTWVHARTHRKFLDLISVLVCVLGKLPIYTYSIVWYSIGLWIHRSCKVAAALNSNQVAFELRLSSLDDSIHQCFNIQLKAVVGVNMCIFFVLLRIPCKLNEHKLEMNELIFI